MLQSPCKILYICTMQICGVYRNTSIHTTRPVHPSTTSLLTVLTVLVFSFHNLGMNDELEMTWILPAGMMASASLEWTKTMKREKDRAIGDRIYFPGPTREMHRDLFIRVGLYFLTPRTTDFEFLFSTRSLAARGGRRRFCQNIQASDGQATISAIK